MNVPGFVPAELRQLLKFVPDRGWDAIEWRPMLGSLRQLSTRYVTGRGASGVRDALSLPMPELRLCRKLSAPPLGVLTRKRDKQLAGDALLRLYFTQWRLDQGMFIDLRPRFFGFTEDAALEFAPNGLWVQLRPEFRDGMLGLYASFYSDDTERFEKALLSMGMLREDLPDAAREKLKSLLFSHFGLNQSAQTFSIDAFQNSFDALFSFFLEHDYKLHSDFVVAGFCLITLYITLESLGQEHNVRSICAEALMSD